MKRQYFCIVLCVAAAHVARAHEFWIEPKSFHVQQASVIPVSLWLGERFDGRLFPRTEHLIDRFEIVGPTESMPVIGRAGDRASFVSVRGEGLHTITYQSHPVHHEMSATAFEDYLHEEGLAHIVTERAKRNETDDPGLERFSRCAKSLIHVGGDDGSGFDRQVGLPLEIIPMTNPFDGNSNELRVRLVFEGKPIAGAKIVAVQKNKPSSYRRVVTNDKGYASVKIDQSGIWMLTSIHMNRVDDDPRAQWESIWASLTFERPDTAAALAAEHSQ